MQFDAKHTAPALVAVCAAALLGLAALPIFFSAATAGIWFGAAILCALTILVLLPVILEPLEHGLDKLAKSQGETRLLARLLLVILELVLVQAILRKPTSLVLASTQPTTVESGIAAGALTILLFLLVWAYQSGRGLLKAVTWSALDAIPTVNPTSSAPAAQDTQLPTLADATLPAHR